MRLIPFVRESGIGSGTPSLQGDCLRRIVQVVFHLKELGTTLGTTNRNCGYFNWNIQSEGIYSFWMRIGKRDANNVLSKIRSFPMLFHNSLTALLIFRFRRLLRFSLYCFRNSFLVGGSMIFVYGICQTIFYLIQTFSHFFRHVKVSLQVSQIFEGKSAFYAFSSQYLF